MEKLKVKDLSKLKQIWGDRGVECKECLVKRVGQQCMLLAQVWIVVSGFAICYILIFSLLFLL
eukprot:12410138-Ditylum_brightwellii.AAC.1